jgi:hypothetical protein
MKHSGSRLLAVAPVAIALAIVTSCAAIGLGKKSYRLEVRPQGNVTSELQSLYVIVSPKQDVQENLLSPSTYKKLLDETAMRKYTALVQYSPVQVEGQTTWKLVYQGNPSKFFKHQVKGSALKFEVGKKLLKSAGMTEYCTVVLAFYGSAGFEQITIHNPALVDGANQVVEVGSSNLQLHDA